jgi:hypothetical protein
MDGDVIRYTLTCDRDHSFDSWFQSTVAFDQLSRSGHVSCAVCGSGNVTKSVMAPAVNVARNRTPEKRDDQTPLAALRARIESESDYVGKAFAAEARAIHDGEQPERAIYGEATHLEVKSLLEDGVPVMPLPFIPRKRSH